MVQNILLKKIKSLVKRKVNYREELYRSWFSSNGDKTLRLDYALNKNSIVFDLGGYEGQWASDIFAKYLCSIYIFEPHYDYFIKIKSRFEQNNFIQIYDFGLSKADDCLDLYISGDASSVYKTEGEKIQIQLKDVIDFINSNNIKKIDLLKINIEGGEYDLMERIIADPIINNITNIQIQFHDFVPNARFRMNKIQEKISQTHSLTYSYEFIWENWQLKDLSNQNIAK